MVSIGVLCELFTLTLVFHLTSTKTVKILSNNTNLDPLSSISNVTTKDNSTKPSVSINLINRLDQGKDMIHNAFSKMDRSTLMRAAIVLSSITALILMYIGLKTFLMGRRRQPKRYTLITDPSTMTEPLFGAADDADEQDIEDDTLFVRK